MYQGGLEKIKQQDVTIVSKLEVVPVNNTIAVPAKTAETVVESLSSQIIAPVTEDENSRLDVALGYQFKADSVGIVADRMRSEMAGLTWDKRVIRQKEINRLDSLVQVYQVLAGSQYSGKPISQTTKIVTASDSEPEPDNREIVQDTLKDEKVIEKPDSPITVKLA